MKKILIFPLIATALILTASVAAVLATRDNRDKPAAANDRTGGTTPAVTVALASEQPAYRIGDKVLFRSTVRNTTDSPLTYTFNSTCTQGVLSIDGIVTQRSLLCGEAMTDVVLQPGEEKSYTYQFKLVGSLGEVTQDQLPAGTIDYDNALALTAGEHQAQLDWRGFKSEPVSFTVR